ncbi:Aspartate aminotransferase [Paramyrothecium foliicola]|nr:Aspartate aminotransferase [Paramyrothecium foliicola]
MGSIAGSKYYPSLFSSLETVPLDGAVVLEVAFREDTHKDKVNLGIGAYRDDHGQPWVLPVVKEAKVRLAAKKEWSHEYLLPQGDEGFLQSARALLFGDAARSSDVSAAIASIQVVSGTGANSLIARFIGRFMKSTQLWLPDPTWPNHLKIWSENAPGIRQRLYPYYDSTSRGFDFDGMMTTLRNDARDGDVIILHACAHNPTGIDPSQSQWREIATICEQKHLFVIFDVAYQGFASGDLDLDAWSVRYFLEQPNIEFATCQSFAKNLGLYGERVGVLHVVASRAAKIPSAARAIRSQLVILQRHDINTVARFGSEVAGLVLSSPELYAIWLDDLKTMTNRLKGMRQALHDELIRLGTPGDWSHLIRQTGMYGYTGLNKEQVAILKKRYHIYMLDTGRLTVCGLTPQNVEYVAQSINRAVEEA